MQGIYVDIPRSDMKFLEELVRKRGWKIRVPFAKAKEHEKQGQADVVDKLYGAVRLPENFDYKAEIKRAILERYL